MGTLWEVNVLHANRKRGWQPCDVGALVLEQAEPSSRQSLFRNRGNDRLLFELAYQLESAKPWANKKAPIAL